MTSASPDDAQWRFPNRATPVGSAAYYAVRFAPPAQRERNAGLLAWFDLVAQIAERPLDPGVARLKLDWWRQEVDNLQRGAVRHPLAIALHAQGLGPGATTPMQHIIDALDRRLRAPAVADLQDFAADCRQTYGELFVLLGASQPREGFDRQHCIESGAYCAAVEHIRLAAQQPQRLPPACAPSALGRLDSAQRVDRLDALLREFDADTPPSRRPIPDLARRLAAQHPQRLPPACAPSSIGRLDSAQRVDRLDALLREFAADTSPSGRPIPDLARRLTALAAAIHKKMRSKGYPVVETLVERAPIANLWTAWRCR